MLETSPPKPGTLSSGTQKAHKHKHFMGIDIPILKGFIITGFIWDIPILIFAYVLFGAL